MKYLLFASLLIMTPTVALANDEIVTFNANKACAALVGIPYASDNFSDQEWEKFKRCVNTMKYFDSNYR